MGREFELKYQADAGKIAEIREKFGDFTSISMETAYYDTPGGDLSARLWTLRLRMENGTPVCTLKTPRPDGSRGEWELECAAIANAIPGLWKQGAPEELLSLTADGVMETCGARFTRLAANLAIEGAAVELALDEGILFGGGQTLPLCEVEVELKSGSREAAEAFAQQIAEEFHLTPEPKSKVQRALALTK